MSENYRIYVPGYGPLDQNSADILVVLGHGVHPDGAVTITPDDGGAGGTFTPATVELSDTVRNATFKYRSVAAGEVTISTTNDGELDDPDAQTMTIPDAAAIPAEAIVLVWNDVEGAAGYEVYVNNVRIGGTGRNLFAFVPHVAKGQIRVNAFAPNGNSLTSLAVDDVAFTALDEGNTIDLGDLDGEGSIGESSTILPG